MAMVVKNNMPAKNTLNQLDKNDKALAKSLKKAASGMKINGAGDDASGYAISERMETQLRSLEQDNANAQNGSSLLKTAEGAIASTVDILKTLKEKVINAANDTNTDADRATIQKELDQAIDQIDDNASVTFNGQLLVDGSKNNEVLHPGTKTSLTNEQLAEDTGRTTDITALKDRGGQSLQILDSDTITVSYVKGGETYVFSQKVDGMMFGEIFDMQDAHGHQLQDDIKMFADTSGDKSIVGTDQYNQKVKTIDGKNAITYQAVEAGIDGQIAGLTICVTDSQGNPKRSANAALDAFTETVRAQNPSPDSALVLQVGTKANQSIKAGLTDMRAVALGLRSSDGKTLQIGTQAQANAAINVIDNALQKVLNQQTDIGSLDSRLEYTSSNLVTASENTQASASVIRDANMAQEMTTYTKNNVLVQAAQSMLAQANQSSSSVLSLLQ
ncbi:flagellin [Selenomonas ruminantium]|uniref:Flagellin n=1 Tax=Selenomonas ruminantium TaxID=971 RepID=A0A1I3FPR9_SELRU|nr:flagellin [Selenomonas ruminantium]SFI13180.1 flagellin [Selenomonas ruminantium]